MKSLLLVLFISFSCIGSADQNQLGASEGGPSDSRICQITPEACSGNVDTE